MLRSSTHDQVVVRVHSIDHPLFLPVALGLIFISEPAAFGHADARSSTGASQLSADDGQSERLSTESEVARTLACGNVILTGPEYQNIVPGTLAPITGK